MRITDVEVINLQFGCADRQGFLYASGSVKGTPLPDGKNSDLLCGAAYLVKAPARVIGRASAG